MKNRVLILVFSLFLIVGAFSVNAMIQDTVQTDMGALMADDSVSVDKMEPAFYSPAEEEDVDDERAEKNSMFIYILGGIVVIGGGIYFYSRSKKK